MHYSGIKSLSTENGPGIRVSLFVSGCRNQCKGCFQPDTWDFCNGELFTEDIEDQIIEDLKPGYVKGLTLLGGDPLEPENQRGVISLVRKVKKKYPEKTIWAYTGYIYEKDFVPGGKNYTEVTEELLGSIDVLVDGPFVEAKRNLMLSYRGSENQRIIDLNATRQCGDIVLSEFMNA